MDIFETKKSQFIVGIALLLLQVLLLLMKLTHAISWPWLWILSPSWIPQIVIYIFIVSVILIFIAVSFWESLGK